jgi:hypothetical protein
LADIVAFMAPQVCVCVCVCVCDQPNHLLGPGITGSLRPHTLVA